MLLAIELKRKKKSYHPHYVNYDRLFCSLYTSGDAKCNVQKCYEDAGIDLTGGSNSTPNW